MAHSMVSEEQAWRIEIWNRTGVVDAVGIGLCGDIADLGVTGVEKAEFIRLYQFLGVLTASEAERIADQLLTDPITQTFHLLSRGQLAVGPGQWGVEVWFRPGVTDAVGETTLKGSRDLGVSGIASVSTGRAYLITGTLFPESVELICRRLLANDVIERYSYYTGT